MYTAITPSLSTQAPSLSSLRAKLGAFRAILWLSSSEPFESRSDPFELMQYQAAGSWSRSLKVASSHYKRLYKLDPLSPEVHFSRNICTVNMSSVCDICGKTFAKPFNLRRHEREVHGHISNDHNVIMSTYAVLQHPLTCIVAGCTQSGKTVWVKTLLENAQKTISPPP